MEFRPGCLNYASEATFRIFIRMEQIFQAISKHIPNKNFDFLYCYKYYVYADNEIRNINIPQCHNAKSKLINMFCLYRVRIYLSKLKRKIRRDVHESSSFYRGSKSAGSRILRFTENVSLNFNSNC